MTATLTESNLQQITEHIRDWRTNDVLIDGDRRVVRNVALSGTKSKNGYRYLANALRKAIPLYENKPVFLDHATTASRPFERSTRDLVGSVVNVRYDDGRLRGDIQTLDTESGRTFVALAESNHPAVGMSHVVLAQRTPNKKTVEKIHEVVSVDAVVFPATTSTFRENYHNQNQSIEGSFEEIIKRIDTLLEAQNETIFANKHESIQRIGVFDKHLVLAVRTEDQKVPQHYLLNWKIENNSLSFSDEPLLLTEEQFANNDFVQAKNSETTEEHNLENERNFSSLESHRDKLRREIDELQEKRRDAEFHNHLDSLLESARLPSFSVTEIFREQLESANDDAQRQMLIDDRHHLLRLAASLSPFSAERKQEDGASLSDTRIVTMIRGKRISA